MAELEVDMFPVLDDNYAFLIHDAGRNVTASIDTPDAEAIAARLADRNWTLTHILNTHHHADHAGGNLALKERYGCTIVGPGHDAQRIPGIDVRVGDGDRFLFGDHEIEVLTTPGHTRGHIVYYLAGAGIAFVGDTLFAMGCGRLFEGSPGQMWTSLQKLLHWPDDTKIYCAHEYTLANGRFALTVEPENDVLRRRVQSVTEQRALGQPTVPTTLGLERQTNPFLRPDSRSLRRTIDLERADDTTVFARTRELKDSFRG